MHVLVYPLHDVRKRLNMMHFWLNAVPLGKRLDLAQVFGMADSPVAPGTERVFKLVQPRQVLDYEIRIGAEGVAVIEMVEPVVAELVAGNTGRERHHHENARPEKQFAARHHEIPKAVEEGMHPDAWGGRAQGQDREHDGQDCYGINKGKQHAESDQIAKNVERRSI